MTRPSLSINTTDIVDGKKVFAETMKARYEQIDAFAEKLTAYCEEEFIMTNPLAAQTITGQDLSMDGQKITDLAAPTADGDAARKKYVDDEIVAAIRYTVVSEQAASGKGAGIGVNNTWINDANKRKINTISPAVDWASVNTETYILTLAAGTYRCRIACPTIEMMQNMARLYNLTADEVTLLGQSNYTAGASYATSCSFIVGEFTIADQSAFVIQHYHKRAPANGFGLPCTITDTVETYTIAEFWKIS